MIYSNARTETPRRIVARWLEQSTSSLEHERDFVDALRVFNRLQILKVLNQDRSKVNVLHFNILNSIVSRVKFGRSSIDPSFGIEFYRLRDGIKVETDHENISTTNRLQGYNFTPLNEKGVEDYNRMVDELYIAVYGQPARGTQRPSIRGNDIVKAISLTEEDERWICQTCFTLIFLPTV